MLRCLFACGLSFNCDLSLPERLFANDEDLECAWDHGRAWCAGPGWGAGRGWRCGRGGGWTVLRGDGEDVACLGIEGEDFGARRCGYGLLHGKAGG